MSRQQMRLLQRQQRDADQARIKGLEHQLCTMRQKLETLSIQNQQLRRRQAALNATLDMQEQLQAAAATAAGCPASAGVLLSHTSFGSVSELCDASGHSDLLSIGLAPTLSGTTIEEVEEGEPGGGDELDESAVDSLLAELAAGTMDGAEDSPSYAAAAPSVLSGPAALHTEALGDTPWRAGGLGAGSSGWFFTAALVQHIEWYRSQVHRLAQLLRVLDGIPPRLRRSLEDYKLHEETMDLLTGVLADIDDWTIRFAALRPEDFGVVLHNNLQEVLDCGGASCSASGDGRPGSSWEGPGSSAASGEHQIGGGGSPGSEARTQAAAGAAGDAHDSGRDTRPEATIWQELVEELALTPQQEQTLEAHQALFEQQEAALEESKAAVLTALADAARRDDKDAATQLLQGAEALRASLQQDMLAKAPTMISLRKVLTPLQMARLIVNCWPFYSTMKNISRAHKERRLAGSLRRGSA